MARAAAEQHDRGMSSWTVAESRTAAAHRWGTGSIAGQAVPACPKLLALQVAQLESVPSLRVCLCLTSAQVLQREHLPFIAPCAPAERHCRVLRAEC